LNKIAAGPKDAAEAKALWTRVQKLVADYGAPIFLFFSSLLAAHSDKVVGLKHIYASGQGFDFAGVGVTR